MRGSKNGVKDGDAGVAGRRRNRPQEAHGAVPETFASDLRPEVRRFLDELRDHPVATAPVSGREPIHRRRKTREERARLIFSLDATMSRQPTWDQASRIQAEMFLEAAKYGGLAIKLVYFRGFRECRATPFLSNPLDLAERMGRIDCRAGSTQIGRVLRHAAKVAREHRIEALVHVGDCCEEDIDTLAGHAGELALIGVPCFFFHEGDDPHAGRAFRELARITGGAALAFDAESPEELAVLLKGLAAWASGGVEGLDRLVRREPRAAPLLRLLPGSDPERERGE